MKRKRHKPEEIVKKLRDAATRLADGAKIEQVCKDLGVSVATYHRWKERYAGAGEGTVKRLKELEKENARLKKLVANQALDIDVLKEINAGKW
jgi:transposase